MTRIFLLLLVLLAGQSCGQSQEKQTGPEDLQHKTFMAKAIRIIDGDTMEVLYRGQSVRIRLTHIDSPERRRSQPFGKAAKQALSSLCHDQEVTIVSEKYDRYGRLLAEVKNERGQIINQEMVKLGMAWHFKRYSSDTTYAHLEEEARRLKIGFWAENDSIIGLMWKQ
ncbi:thermonuclease family protein [Sphingobacterium olei]|uniref:Thermonuclease family protein n=1 Tax=Sphingobacterium olei TaxID=2571155 RepID=A0A4U0PJB2_9SPHI|nr:thermonuclease family protein [Sphingobacterium olei]TJZ62984.1 thermonuclease family protein [Sphingobacterium olei]